VKLERRPVEIADVVAQAIEMVGPLLAQRAHRLSIEVPPDGLSVEGDAARLAQVVSNLLMNAAKYTPGAGRVEVRAAAEGADAVVTVRDNGMGIAPELLPSVFDLFVQGPRARDRADGGLGLGLTIVKSLVELHGGTVGVTSAGIGCGAEFTVRLPLAHAAVRDEGAVAAPRANGRGLRVLIVDDNVDAALTLAELLGAMGCEARVAHDGPAALLAAQGFAPQLVLLDIGLPVMDGYEVASRLRRGGLERSFVAALTGYGQPEDRERSRRAGFDEHFVKPMAPETLRVLVATLANAPPEDASPA
jgi:CheY-like chemotaxis protein